MPELEIEGENHVRRKEQQYIEVVADIEDVHTFESALKRQVQLDKLLLELVEEPRMWFEERCMWVQEAVVEQFGSWEHSHFSHNLTDGCVPSKDMVSLLVQAFEWVRHSRNRFLEVVVVEGSNGVLVYKASSIWEVVKWLRKLLKQHIQ